MEFTNDVLRDMQRKKALYNRKFANWYYSLYRESGGEIKSIVDSYTKRKFLKPVGGNESYFNRGDRISACCDLWVWDCYEQNKLLDLKKLNRCRNGRFCPNCKMLNVQKFIHEFKALLPDLEDYDFYMLTSTIPSIPCDGTELRDTIDKIYYTFRKLNHKYSVPLFTDTGRPSKQALQCRLIDIVGGVRVLEITYNVLKGFHPHIHSIVLVPRDSVGSDDLEKRYEGKYSRKRQKYNMKSDIDIQLAKAWTMIWYGIDFRKWDSVYYNPKATYLQIDGKDTEYKCLEVDFVPLDSDGIFEVFKYTFKSSEVKSVRVFKALVEALHGKRIRQGFGVLYNLKCEDDCDSGELQELQLEIEEEPIELLTREFDELLTKFADYRKISRYNPVDKYDVATRLAD